MESRAEFGQLNDGAGSIVTSSSPKNLYWKEVHYVKPLRTDKQQGPEILQWNC